MPQASQFVIAGLAQKGWILSSDLASTYEQISATAHEEKARAELNDAPKLKIKYGTQQILVYWNCLIP